MTTSASAPSVTPAFSGPLASMASAAPGAVVSRVLLRTSGAVATLFHFAPGEGLTEHTTPHEAFIVILDGSVTVTLGETDYPLEAGDALHLPAGAPHALTSEVGFRMLLSILKGESGTG